MSTSATGAAGLRVAIIGVGRMGVRHLQAARQLGMSVVGLADAVEGTLFAAADAEHVDRSACYLDAAQMLRQTRPEAVVVATTAPTHAPFVIAAVDNKAHFILCEKPMALSLAEADTMIDACRRADVRLAINHQMRFMPNYTAVKALFGCEELGPLVSVVIAGSNFGLAMNASHLFEAFAYLTDSRVASVQAWLDEGRLPNPRGAQFEDRSGRLMARSEAGHTMYIDFAAAAGHGMQVTYTCRLGQIVVDELSGNMRVVSRKSEFRELPTTRYCMPAEERQVSIEPVEALAPTLAVWSALLAGHDYPDGAAGEQALACVVAAHVSHEQGSRVVRLNEPGLPRGREFKWA